MTTHTERFTRIQKDINRMLDLVQEKATVDDALEYTTDENEMLEDFHQRLITLEKLWSALVYKIEILEKNGVI